MIKQNLHVRKLMWQLCVIVVKVSNERQNKDGGNESELVRVFDAAFVTLMAFIGLRCRIQKNGGLFRMLIDCLVWHSLCSCDY